MPPAADSVFSTLDTWQVVVNVLLSLVLGQIIAWHYTYFAQVLSNKRKFSRMFPFVAATTALMITIVKSSLALSLGLVGALSIIRFRTPIKEPEELAYLFLSIAVGLGFGADQRVITAVAVGVLLVFLALRALVGGGKADLRTVLLITAPVPEGGRHGPGLNGLAGGSEQTPDQLRAMLPTIESKCGKADLRRVDWLPGEFSATFVVEMKSPEVVSDLVAELRKLAPGATVSVVERDSGD
jgi:hypothetical protein